MLGQAYNAADAQIQREDVEACMSPGQAAVPNISPDTPVYLGIDVGFQCYLTLSYDDDKGVTHWILFEQIPYTRLETRIAELRSVYSIVQGTIDRFPFEPTAAALREFTQGVVMPIQYRGTAALVPQKDELGVLTHYSANQTMVFDRILAAVTQRKMVISGYTHLRETLIAHLCDMVRDENPDALADAKWKKTSGNDHFFHSMAFNLLARRICEHMYQTQSGIIATSSAIVGTDIGAHSQGNLLGSASKSSRLGAHGAGVLG